MCGIVGIYSHDPVAQELYDSLIHLQHRGQDAAGILTSQQRFNLKHGLGLVREIFRAEDIFSLQGNMGIAHVRYPTTGGYNAADVQPLWIGSPLGIALAHNGNLINYESLAARLRQVQHRHLNSSLDSEVLLHLLADQLAQDFNPQQSPSLFFEKLCLAIQYLFKTVQGSYSVVSLVMGKGLVIFRDPHGIRPLVWGERKREDGQSDYIFASESTAFYALGFEMRGDVAPGELFFVDESGQLFNKKLQQAPFRPCVFEYVYFARPDSILNGVSVYRSRLRMGQNLAKKWQEKYPEIKPDIVIPAPFTANTAALSFAHELGVCYSEGLYKNAFIGRTFIMPNQKARMRQVRYKLSPQHTEINNKHVLIVDDSIVRGTTSKEIVKMVREAGAKTICFVSTSPAIKHPCFYGIDIPSPDELIAAKETEDNIRIYLGVDYLLYQDIDHLIEAVTRKGDHQIEKPCMACMNGHYVCGNLTEVKIKELTEKRLEERTAS